MSIRNVKNKIVNINEFYIFRIYINDILLKFKVVTAIVIVETHLINDLKINMLIDTDIIIF